MFDETSLPTEYRQPYNGTARANGMLRVVGMNLSIPAGCVKGMRNARDLCGRRSTDRWVLSHEHVLSPKLQSSWEKVRIN